MRKNNVWKKAIALVLAAAVALGNGMPLQAAGDAGNNTPATGTTDNTTGNEPLVFDFDNASMTEVVTGSDGTQKFKKCVTNNVTFTTNIGRTNIELVDAPTAEGDTTPHGKALKFNKGSGDGTFLTTESGALAKYDFSAGVKVSMDVYVEEGQDTWNYLFSLGQMNPDKYNVRGTISFITMSQDEGWNGYWPADGWVEDNKIDSNDHYLVEEQQFNKWHNIEYIFTEKGLTIALDGDPVVAQPDKAESMKQVLGKMSEGQLRLGSNAGKNGGNYFKGYMDNVKLTPIKSHTHIGADGKELTLTKTSDPSCTEKGYERWTSPCATCGTIESIATPALGHDYEKVERSEPTCTKAGYEEHYQCKRTECSQWAVDGEPGEDGKIPKKEIDSSDIQIRKLDHAYGEPQITKATLQQDGKVEKICTRCPEGTTGHIKTETIYMASDITLAETSYAYTGNEIKPDVTVKDSKGKVIAAENYTVTYQNNKNAGKATVTIEFKGDRYEGKTTREFTITSTAPQATLDLHTSEVTLYTGNASNTIKIQPTVTGASQGITWNSDNAKVATVKDGTITAVKAGKATISATANGITRKITVTVKNPTITVKNGKKKINSITVKKNKKATLTVSVNPKNSGSSLTKLSAKNKKIVSVTYKKGKLTIKGKKKGTVTIKIKSGKATKNIKIKVK